MTAVAGVPVSPVLITGREELRRVRARMPGRVAVVMTLGALHAGHRALVARAQEVADHVIVTIFVNPLQFGPGEDYERYPRTLDGDLDQLAGVDVVLVPQVTDVFPSGAPSVTVAAGAAGAVLEGAARPGHFDGVLTVVSILLHLTGADVAVFGRKDAQQLALVRRMVSDLAHPVEIVAVDTVRDPDGLALSSRNAYLSGGQRASALAIPAALQAARRAAAGGADATGVMAAAREVLASAGGLHVEYVEIVDPGTVEPLRPGHAGHALVVVAAVVGRTRLIDNITVDIRADGTAAGGA